MHPFRKLIHISLGRASSFEKKLTPGDWHILLHMAKVQTLTGVLWDGVRRLPEDQRPPDDVFQEWERLADKIGEVYRRHEQRVAELEAFLSEKGLHGCILKGVGLSRLYPVPERRMSGDIDVWIQGRREDILRRLTQEGVPVYEILYQECKADLFVDTVVEVHFRPSKAYNPFRNARLQRCLRKMSPIRDDAALSWPDALFNAVYCMAHMYRHYLEGGLGMRQMMDYYYILQELSPTERQQAMKLLRRLGMGRFTAAMMTSVQFNFGLEDEYLLCPPDRKLGEKLVKDTISMGNFGVLDERNRSREGESRLARFIRKNKRVFSNFRFYPGEVVWSPFARISQYVWRHLHGYI